MKYSSSMDGGEEGGGCLLFWWRHGWLGPNTAVSQRVPDRHQHNCCITITLEPVSRINYITSRLLNISYWMSTQKYVSLQLQCILLNVTFVKRYSSPVNWFVQLWIITFHFDIFLGDFTNTGRDGRKKQIWRKGFFPIGKVWLQISSSSFPF